MWRGGGIGGIDEAIYVFQTVTECHMTQMKVVASDAPRKGFTATIGLPTQIETFEMDRMGNYQR